MAIERDNRVLKTSGITVMYRIKYYQGPQAEKQFYNLIQLFVSFLVFNLEVLFTTHCTTMQSDTFRAFNLSKIVSTCDRK